MTLGNARICKISLIQIGYDLKITSTGHNNSRAWLKQVPQDSDSTFVAGSLAPAGAGPGGGRPPHLHRLAAQDGDGEAEE